jgi:N-acetylneuraminic acid mutarotase
MDFKRNRQGLIFTIFSLIVLSACSSAPHVKTTGLSLPNGLYGHAAVNNGDKIFVLGGANEDGFSGDVLIVDPLNQTIEQLKDKLIPRRYHSAVWDGHNSIYVIGGVSFNNKRISLEPMVEVYDIPSGQVSQLGNMPVPRRFGSAVYLDGKIVVIGGGKFVKRATVEAEATDTVAIYNIAEGKWRPGPSLPAKLSTRAVVIGKDIYTVGGFNGHLASMSAYRLHMADNKWDLASVLPQRISANSVVIAGERLYSFGDYEELNANFVYDFAEANWKKKPFTYQSSRHNAATVLNDKIYVLGGTLGGSGPFLDTIQVFSVN